MKHEYAKEFVAPAVEYLTAAKAQSKSDDRYAKVLRAPVCEALIGFCREDGEFAEAVAQSKNIEGCLAAISKGIGSAISDLEVYARAARFYFPDAKIKMHMTIDLDGEGDAKEETQKPRRLELSIGDLL